MTVVMIFITLVTVWSIVLDILLKSLQSKVGFIGWVGVIFNMHKISCQIKRKRMLSKKQLNLITKQNGMPLQISIHQELLNPSPGSKCCQCVAVHFLSFPWSGTGM